ncbi:hypothetical protein pEaSNUABM37_00211 [Erwinia phage pEa_SNUABM_37]|nr:hypothetical protein pEaSNUABM37_00211 [Erwinia phage pEa_SNUABM_37]QXO10681.1 hypothetical protein pEaSNUABM48_00211 [Erwinia phage pEa_SNUABM_48]
MSFNNLILGMGLDAFEDQSEDALPIPADQVYVEAVPVEEANVLVVERNVALEDREYVEAGAALTEALAENQNLMQTVDTLDTISASMESYMAAGTISPEVAKLLHMQLSEALESIGGDASAIGGGLESFDDNEATLAFFGAGLEALNNAKGTIGSKIAGGLVGMNQSIQRWVEGVATKAGRIRKSAGEIIKEAQTASGSRTVKSKNKFLAVKQDKASANIVSDLSQFSKMITDLSSGYMGKVGSFANGQINSALSQMKTVNKLVEAKAIVDKLAPPPYPGATINIKDTPKLTLKRTEVTLGGFAVFELRYKASQGDTANEVTSQVKVIGMHRVSLKRPKEEKGGKVVYEATHTPADAVKIANEVIKCCDAALAVQRNVKWTVPFFTAVNQHVKALEASVLTTNTSAEKGVNTVVYTLCKLPSQLIDSVGSLVREIPTAVTSVCEAALDVARQAARGGSEAPAPKEGNEE